MNLPTLPPPSRLVLAACVLALVGLGFIVWSVLDPRPAPVLLALSFGQAIGTLSFATFVVVVLLDLRATWRRRRPDEASEPPARG